jgi:TolA-binding protein
MHRTQPMHPTRLRPELLLVAILLAGCAGTARKDDGTLRSLADRPEVKVEPGQPAQGAVDRTMAAYERFLRNAPAASEKPEAQRRLADLAMQNAESRAGAGDAESAGHDFASATSQYRAYLEAYPGDTGNDLVLYQLAHAQEQGGDLAGALETLSRLVRDYPQTRYREEANFRRGEMLFAMRDYPGAEQAYGSIAGASAYSQYYQRSLYMLGWSAFKQSRLEDALHSFLGVLDLRLIGREGEGDLDTVQGLTRADRELLEDTLRVTSLCFENLQGAESIPQFMTSNLRRDYEYRLYASLGDLYLKQERVKDAADTLAAFATLHPLSAQAPLLQARVIDIYGQFGFSGLALEGKKLYVEHFGAHSEFRRASPKGWEKAQPLVRQFLGELSRNAHALAQKEPRMEQRVAAVDEAARWYGELLESFPADPQAAHNTFLLGELLYENRRYAAAAEQYEKAAYGFDPPGAQAADAGYGALLALAAREKAAPAPEQAAARLAVIESALRFADAFRRETRTAAVLADAADRLYAMHDPVRAVDTALRVLSAYPPATDAQSRTAWLIIAHSSFEAGEFARSEHAYQEVLALSPREDPSRGELTERVAASVYRQGEQARDAGDPALAAAHFDRIAEVAPASPVRATAQYDAAAARMLLKDWAGAARTLEDFRARYPGHALQAEVTEKLAAVWFEAANWAKAASEFELLASTRKDAKAARGALWQAAELRVKAGDGAGAQRTWEHYVLAWPAPLEDAQEARARLQGFAKERGDRVRELALARDILAADQAGGAARTERTRYLGARSALLLAEPVLEEYRKVALVEPLKKQLKLKKSRLEEVLKAYAVAADYGVADVATAATHHTAELYHDFGKAMLASQRPKGLSKDEVEQYNVLLEEQAFPFEEKAIELHEVNARRSAQGIFDEWVRASFAALAELRPMRYGKGEQSEVSIHAIR